MCIRDSLYGTRMEKACAPAINTGMFAAMKEAGDVMGTFVGHDHDNDYSVMWKGIVPVSYTHLWLRCQHQVGDYRNL